MTELRNIGAQMANVMFNLSQRPGSALDPSAIAIMDGLRRDWDAARATPPSPSTAPAGRRKILMPRGMIDVTPNIAPEVGIAVSNNDLGVHIVVSQRHADGSVTVIYSAKAPAGDSFGRAALASRPAEVDGEGLPPLPDRYVQVSTFPDRKYFTAEQYRQGQRDAVAADRARRPAAGGSQ